MPYVPYTGPAVRGHRAAPGPTRSQRRADRVLSHPVLRRVAGRNSPASVPSEQVTMILIRCAWIIRCASAAASLPGSTVDAPNCITSPAEVSAAAAVVGGREGRPRPRPPGRLRRRTGFAPDPTTDLRQMCDACQGPQTGGRHCMVLGGSAPRQRTDSRRGVHDRAGWPRRMSAQIIRFWLLAMGTSAGLWGDAGCWLRPGRRWPLPGSGRLRDRPDARARNGLLAHRGDLGPGVRVPIRHGRRLAPPAATPAGAQPRVEGLAYLGLAGWAALTGARSDH